MVDRADVAAYEAMIVREHRSLVRAALEARPFVRAGLARNAGLLRSIAESSRRREAELARRLTEADAALPFVSPDIGVMRLHYLKLDYLLAELVRDERGLAEAYRQAAARAVGDEAKRVLSRFAAEHEEHAAALAGESVSMS